MPTTANFGWLIPTINGSAGTWDDILNALALLIDSKTKEVKDTADAALPKAGGTANVMAGALNGLTVDGTAANQGTVTYPSDTLTLDLSTGDYFYCTRSGVVPVQFTNWPAAGRVQFVTLVVSSTAQLSGMTWPAAVKWDTIFTNPQYIYTGVVAYVFWSRDGGVTIRGKSIYVK